MILEYATVYPFRLRNDSMVCVYCSDEYVDPETYRQHMREDHTTYNVDVALASLHFHCTEFLRVDCYEMTCRICFKKFETIELIASHLNEIHGKNLDLSKEIKMQRFKLGPERWVCALCPQKLPSLRELNRHTGVHYRKFICEICGKSYLNKENLQRHTKYGHAKGKICVKCNQEFTSCKARREHILSSEMCWPYVCHTCGKRFLSVKSKGEHQTQNHGLSPKTHVCPECGEEFLKWPAYRAHYVLSHTNSYYSCSICNLKFDSKRYWVEHQRKHTKEKPFSCDFCDKTFARKKYLVQHSWMHKQQKRYECTLCNRKFNQRVSWKTHMKSKHPDLVTF